MTLLKLKNFLKYLLQFLWGEQYLLKGTKPLEAARYGCRIFHGPNIDNFKDVFALLNKLAISKEIRSVKKLVPQIKFDKKIKGSNKLKKLED